MSGFLDYRSTFQWLLESMFAYANNIEIANNNTYDTVKSGISTWDSTNVVINSNDIALACNSHPNYPISEENIPSANSSNVEVKNNLVHQAANIPDGASGGEGINIKDGSHDGKVHNNIVHLDERTDGEPSNRLAYGLDAWNNVNVPMILSSMTTLPITPPMVLLSIRARRSR